MKKRITATFCTLVYIVGFMALWFILKLLVPEWIFYTVFIIVLVSLIWSETKEDEPHYYMYTMLQKDKTVVGIKKTKDEKLQLDKSNISDVMNSHFCSFTEIDKETYDLFSIEIENNNKSLKSSEECENKRV